MTNFIVNVILICFSKNNEQVKLEPRSPAKPSRVVHIRNIPNDVTEAEIVHLGIPFGRVTNVLVLKGKNQVRSLSSGHLVSRSSGPRRRPYFFFVDRSQGCCPSATTGFDDDDDIKTTPTNNGTCVAILFGNLTGVLGDGGRRCCYFDGQLLQQWDVGPAARP